MVERDEYSLKQYSIMQIKEVLSRVQTWQKDNTRLYAALYFAQCASSKLCGRDGQDKGLTNVLRECIIEMDFPE